MQRTALSRDNSWKGPVSVPHSGHWLEFRGPKSFVNSRGPTKANARNRSGSAASCIVRRRIVTACTETGRCPWTIVPQPMFPALPRLERWHRWRRWRMAGDTGPLAPNGQWPLQFGAAFPGYSAFAIAQNRGAGRREGRLRAPDDHPALSPSRISRAAASVRRSDRRFARFPRFAMPLRCEDSICGGGKVELGRDLRLTPQKPVLPASAAVSGP